MRLGQLARKYDISIEVLISSIKKNGFDVSELKPNSKLDEETEGMLAEQYEPSINVAIEVDEAIADEIEENLLEDDGDIETTKLEPIEDQDVLLPESEFEELPKMDEKDILMPETELKELPRIEHQETIETDRLLELLESEDTEVDLSNITLIKASKKELTGLKVLGKIELEEPKPKTIDSTEEEEETEAGTERETKDQQRQLILEEKEKRRLKFKKRREEYDALQEKQEKEKQQNQAKSIKKAHYEQKLKSKRPNQSKKKEKIIELQELEPEVLEQRPIAKTVFGKLWRWLNSE